jgi:putative oxidoreductase
LQKLYSVFPAEWPGLGLLVLRLLIGSGLILEGVNFVESAKLVLSISSLCGVCAIGGAICLLIGFLTPVVSTLVALGSVALVVGGPGIHTQVLLDTNPTIVNLIVTAVAIALALLGPGAYSIDARRFGRREIRIPTHR